MFNLFKKKADEPRQLFFHTDIHCHLIPGIDDGQKEAAGGAALVEREKQWGVDRIILTPHVTQDTFENNPQIISAAFGRLREAVKECGIEGMELLHAAEHRLDGLFNEQMEAGILNEMPNRYLLVENSFVQEAWEIDRRLFDLKISGFKPILAHPERYHYYIGKRDRYRQLHTGGTFFQVNVLSLAGHYGKAVKQNAEMLMEMDLVDFLGTDMHNETHAAVIDAYLGSKDYQKHRRLLEGRILNDTAFNS